MKKTLFLFFIVFHLSVFAQHDIYVGGQLDMGIVGKTSFENNTLDKKNYSPHLGGLLFANFRLFDVMSLELGIGQNWNNSRFKDPDFERENEGFSVEMNNKNYYWSYYAAVSALIRINSSKTYLYGKLGYSVNTYGKQSITKEKSFAISRLAIDQTISSSTSYAQSNESFIPEIGVQRKLSNRNILSAGLKINIGRTDALNGTYTIKDNITGEAVHDNFSSLGNFTSLSVQYNVLLHHLPRREKVKRIPKVIVKKPDEIKTNQDTVMNDDTVIHKDTVKKDPEVPTEIADRKLVISRKVKVHTSKVKIFIWDHQNVDGDRVSLNLNGKWILENYTLKKEKHSIEIELEEGINIFVLHALNLGKYSPNTAALIVKEQVKSHKIILESDLNESGSLEINYKKKK